VDVKERDEEEEREARRNQSAKVTVDSIGGFPLDIVIHDSLSLDSASQLSASQQISGGSRDMNLGGGGSGDGGGRIHEASPSRRDGGGGSARRSDDGSGGGGSMRVDGSSGDWGRGRSGDGGGWGREAGFGSFPLKSRIDAGLSLDNAGQLSASQPISGGSGDVNLGGRVDEVRRIGGGSGSAGNSDDGSGGDGSMRVDGSSRDGVGARSGDDGSWSREAGFGGFPMKSRTDAGISLDSDRQLSSSRPISGGGGGMGTENDALSNERYASADRDVLDTSTPPVNEVSGTFDRTTTGFFGGGSSFFGGGRGKPITPNPILLSPHSITLHPAPCTLHPVPYTLHPTPYTLHPTPLTLNPRPQARASCSLVS
jgi:hypothetical protein